MENQENSFSQNNYLRFLPIVLFFGGLFFLSVASGLFFFKNSSSSDDIEIISASATSNDVGGEIVVHVDGAVIKPGVYNLSSDSRVANAVEAAGGLASDADGSRINLAAKVSDGQKIHIAKAGEVAGPVSNVQGESLYVGSSDFGSLVNINTATEAQLDKLPGIGPVTANKIITGRPYNSLEDLLSKKAVGRSVYEKIRELITF